MAHIGEPIILMPWSGGLDTVTNPTVADPQKVDVAINIEFAFDGTRTKRGGVNKYNTIPIIDTEEV